LGKIEEYNAIRNNPSLSTAEKMKQMAAVQAKYESGSASSAGVTGGMTGASIALRGRTSTTPQMKTGKNSLRSVVKPEKTSVPITTSVIDRFIPSGFREGLKTIEGKIQSGEIKPATTVTGTMIPATPTIVTTPKTTAFAATAGAMAGIKIATTPTSKPVTSTLTTQKTKPSIHEVSSKAAIFGLKVATGDIKVKHDVEDPYADLPWSKSGFISYLEPQMDLYRQRWKDVDVTMDYENIETGEIITGEKLKKIRKQEYEDFNELYTDALKLKPYHRIKKTDTGFEKYTDQFEKAQFEWEQLEWWQQAGKAFFVGATQWPETIARAPVIRDIPLIGAGKGYDDYGKELAIQESVTWEHAKQARKGMEYQVSGLMSGDKNKYAKGVIMQTDFAKDVVLSPAMMEVYGYGGFKVLSAAARPVTRGVIRGLTNVGSKTLRFSGSSLSRIPILSKIAKTEVGIRSYQWATQGYKFGKRLAPGGAKDISRIYIGKSEIMSKTVVEGGKKIERIWMSPAQQRTANIALAKKLMEPATIDIPFPKSGSDVIFTKTGSWQMKGNKLFRNITTFSSGYKEPVINKNWFISAVDDIGFTGYSKKFGSKTIGYIDDISGDYVTRLKPYEARFRVFPESKMILDKTIVDKYGSRRLAVRASYNLDDTVKLFERKTVYPTNIIKGSRSTKYNFFTGPSIDTPMSAWAKMARGSGETWTRKYMFRHPIKHLVRSKSASQTLIPSVKSVIPRSNGSVFNSGRLGIIQRLNAPVIPARSGLPSFIDFIPSIISKPKNIQNIQPILKIGNINIQPILKIGNINNEKRLSASGYISITKTSPDIDKDFERNIIVLPQMKQSEIMKNVQGTISLQRQEQKSLLVPVPVTDIRNRTKIVSITNFMDTRLKTDIPFIIPGMKTGGGGSSGGLTDIPFIIPGMKTGGGGSSGGFYNLYGKKYKYREFKIKDILKELRSDFL